MNIHDKKEKISNRIKELRLLMVENQIDAYIITGTDPHLSEYTPDIWKTREWISGFTGSFGKILITHDKALLWTDTRYFLQAANELVGTEIVMMKERILGAISIEDWITANLDVGQSVAVDGLTISANDAAQIENKLSAKGIIFRNDLDLVSRIWIDRDISTNLPAFEHELKFAGKSRREKIELVRSKLIANKLDSTIISMLDDISWLFNLRSNDILYNPVVTAYSYIDRDCAYLFINPDKLNKNLRVSLEHDSIIVISYESFLIFLSRIQNQKIQFDPIRSNSLVLKHISESNSIESSVSITALIKAVKDTDEVRNIRSAHIKDGAAMVNALYWISHSIKNEYITEILVGQKLNEFRSKQPLFMGDSFHPIVSFGSHGAIVHYHATTLTDRVITTDNLLLIDSGGQYLDGTTDITRTIGLGFVTINQKEDFTTCLRGHIALATTIFPVGTKGYSLDSITRKPLWDKGINYGHGTGHGIGYFLSVHEGPMSIRAEFNNEPIKEGHLLTNEPGIYREGEYGIRLENVILCKNFKSSEFGDFLCFETLSLCPIDRNMILVELLTVDEIIWINHYHETVRQEISPLIKDHKILKWLEEQCQPLMK